jgi:hypothetical protein
MIRTRTAALVSLAAHLQECGVPRQVHSAFLALIKHYLLNDTLPTNLPTDIADALTDQLHLGMDLTLRGYLNNKWVRAMTSHAEGHTDRRMNALYTGLWTFLFEPTWQQRNDILHKPHSIAARYEHGQLNKDLMQWKIHSAARLHHTQQHLTSYTHADLNHWTLRQKHNILHLLALANKNYMERLRSEVGGAQPLITSYLTHSQRDTTE